MSNAIRMILTDRLATRMGLEYPAYVQQVGDTVIAWDGTSALVAIGPVGSDLSAAAAGGSIVEEAPPLPGAAARLAQPQETPVVPLTTMTMTPAPLPVTPSQQDKPHDWFLQATDATALRTWVLTEGITGPHAVEWSEFASSMGWEITVPTLPPPPPAEAAPDQAAPGVPL